MSIYVFLGPTLPVDRAKEILDAHYLAPVVGGDVQRLMARSPAIIGIIDGLFEQTASVYHKEILYALSKGVRVFGASSMGALRAAELHSFGMIGVGKIFERYKSGELEDDDEVAVNHGLEGQGYKALSEAMVNLRDGLASAQEAGVVSAETRATLLHVAKETYYVDRSWKQLYHDGRKAGVAAQELEALAAFVSRTQPNLKRDDAIRLLEKIAREATERHPAPRPFHFEPSAPWQEIRRNAVREGRYIEFQGRREATPSLEEFQLHARLFAKSPQENLRRALFYTLVEQMATRLRLPVDEQEIDDMQALLELDTRHVTQAAIRSLARLEVLMQQLPNKLSVESALPLALLRSNELGPIVERVHEQWRWALEQGLERPNLKDSGVVLETLLDWYRKKSGLDAPSLEAYAEVLGIDEYDFLTEALRSYLFERRASGDTAAQAESPPGPGAR